MDVRLWADLGGADGPRGVGETGPTGGADALGDALIVVSLSRPSRR